MNDSASATRYETISVSDKSTVVAEFKADSKKESNYQSEADLEAEFIQLLQEQAYEYLPLRSEEDLISNLRLQLQALNNIHFTDKEWEQFFREKIASQNEGIVEKTFRIQEDHIQNLKREDGTEKNIYLVDKQNIHNNRLQVINQYEIIGARSNRYDVTILVNGLPLVHIELKRRGAKIREAFNQINRYQRDSFWSGSGLFEYVQIFVISNGTRTKYYSNTTRDSHLAEMSGSRRSSKRKTSDSFEFTSWWADANNKAITDLVGFTRTFFAKHALLNILTRYCVFDVDKKLLVMRPYQIVATERILQRIEVSTNHKQTGSLAAGGYIWHTTGSGKTLTSFKTAQLATKLADVEKVLFVVDRKDLDFQTMKEYDKFETGAANSNKSTNELKKQLSDSNSRIIITTIQKLAKFINLNPEHQVFSGHIVLIFDECHRSQFGDMQKAITRAFKNYHLFGFTGTPIFADNAASGGDPRLKTTEQVFGDKLHMYTIVDAINDKNVLPFRIDYHKTVTISPTATNELVPGIDTENALLSYERLYEISHYVLDHFDQKTKRSSSYRYKDKRIKGFNSIFAAQSIEAAKRYYQMFQMLQKERKEESASYEPLKIAIIYSFVANEEQGGGLLADEEFETDDLDQTSRDFLESAIGDYNGIFGTSWNTSSDKFEGYYKDVSEKLKTRELDMVIVVNMFLTGFDATTLNTLWVDKNLRQHGLIQAFSRTNRILNSVKVFGNIVSFRNLEKQTNDALALFGNKDAMGVVVLKPYLEYLKEYSEKATELMAEYTIGPPIIGEQNQKDFIQLYGAILRLRNILTSFDEFVNDDILSPRDVQDYQSMYLDIYQDFRRRDEAEKESITEDLVFEIELIKQVDINVDYILQLVMRYLESKGGEGDLEIRVEINRAIDSSPTLRNKKDLVEQFVDSLNVDAKVDDDWKAFIEAKKTEELDRIIVDEGLDKKKTEAFIKRALKDGGVVTAGTDVAQILPAMPRFSGQGGGYAEKKQTVIEKLSNFFDRFFDLS